MTGPVDAAQQTELDADQLKQVAFMVAQTSALCAGRELYTKAALCEAYPQLRPHLQRAAADAGALTAALRAMLCAIGGNFRQSGSTVLFFDALRAPALLDFGKNRCRALMEGPLATAYFRVSDALIVSVAPPHWKCDAATRKRCAAPGCYDAHGNALV